MPYNIEKYWSEVAKEIKQRKDSKFLAGESDAYWKYKRDKFIDSFRIIDMSEHSTILEVGCGPGGNLLELTTIGAGKKIYGVDISQEMCRLSKDNLANYDKVGICRIDGNTLPFKNNAMDLVFSVTVLHHITDEKMLRNIMYEMCRVGKKEIILFEAVIPECRYHPPLLDDSFVARPITYYKDIMKEFRWKLIDEDLIITRASCIIAHYPFLGWNLICRKLGWTQKLGISNLYLRMMLKITKHLDEVVNTNLGLGRMKFEPI